MATRIEKKPTSFKASKHVEERTQPTSTFKKPAAGSERMIGIDMAPKGTKNLSKFKKSTLIY